MGGTFFFGGIEKSATAQALVSEQAAGCGDWTTLAENDLTTK